MSNSLLLYDNDCGICTKSARFMSKLFSIEIVPMNDRSMLVRGIDAIGESDYWRSFHVVTGDHWTTEDKAIIKLFRILPLGSFIHRVIQIPIFMKLSMLVLKYMQNTRKLECKI